METLTSDFEAVHVSNTSENESLALSVQTREEVPIETTEQARVRLPGPTTQRHPSSEPEIDGQNLLISEVSTEQTFITQARPNPDMSSGVVVKSSPTPKDDDKVDQIITKDSNVLLFFPAVIVGENFSIMPKGMSTKDGEMAMAIGFRTRHQLRSFIEVRLKFPREAHDEPVIARWFITKENVTELFSAVSITSESLQKDNTFILQLDKSFLRDAEKDRLWKIILPHVPTGSDMASNMSPSVESPKIGQSLRPFHDLLTQGNPLTFLIRGGGIDDDATDIQKAWSREDNNLLNLQWFPGNILEFQWADLMEQNADHRPRDKIKPMPVFYDFQEYYTLLGFGTVQDFEYEWQNALALQANRDLKVTALSIPGAENRKYFMFLELPRSLGALRLTAGDALRLDFFPNKVLTDEEGEKRTWAAHVQKPHPSAPTSYLTLIATRPWIRHDGWVEDNPENPLRPIQYQEHQNRDSLQDAISRAHATPVSVSMVIPDQTAKEQIHALNTLKDAGEKDKMNIKHILTHGNYEQIPLVNVFENVDPAALIRLHARSLSDHQRKFVKVLENGVPGGLCLGHGPPGTGKTWIIKQIVRAFTESRKPVMVTATMAWTVSRLATGLGSLAQELKEFLGRDTMIIRFYSKATELALFDCDLPVERNETDRPPIIQSTTPLPAGSLGKVLQQKCRGMDAKGGQVKRVKNEELSLSSWMKRWLGILKDDLLKENRLDSWGSLRELYDKMLAGDPLEDGDSESYEKLKKALAEEIIRKTDIVVCTLASAAESWIRENANPEVIFVDEAGKSMEAELFPVFGYYAGAKYVLVGDHRQLPPTVKSPLAWNNLAEQMSMSLLERLQQNGFPSVMFNEQHRMIPLIADIVSDIFYHGKLLNAPSTADREVSVDISKYNEEKFGISSPVLLLNVKGSEDDRQGPNKSRVNPDNVNIALDLIVDLAIKKSVVDPGNILCTTAYHGQSVLHSFAVDQCAEVNPAIKKVTFNKIDAGQGEEAEVVVLDLTVQSSIGFMSVPNRLNVALSRARSALYIIGTDDVLKNSKSEEDCKYLLQLWKLCAERGIIVKMKKPPGCKYVGDNDSDSDSEGTNTHHALETEATKDSSDATTSSSNWKWEDSVGNEKVAW